MSRISTIALILLSLVPGGNALRAGNAGDVVYVWRMQRTPELATAVRTAKDERLLALAAEITVVKGRSVVRRADAAAVARECGATFVPVLRLGRFPGDFSSDAVWRDTVEKEAVAAAALAKSDTVQLDFDCPENRLAGYATVISGIRAHRPDLKITVTGMPCWLDRKELPALLATTAGWTLQLHLTDLPVARDRPLPPLCDTARARDRIAKAEALRHPFHIALPTYAYLARFDASGRFAGVEAETLRSAGAEEGAVRWAPDFPELASLVRELRARPPAHLAGLAWFRLPCGDDRMNLTAGAFAKLRRGEVPAPGKLGWRLARSDHDRLVDITAVNTGELDVDLAGTFEVRFPEGAPRVYDLPDATLVRKTDTTLQVSFPGARLRPGESAVAGWLRFDAPAPYLSLEPVSP